MAIQQVQQELSVDRIPPQNLEAEMALLGSMLLEEEAVGRAIDLVHDDSFYRGSHRKIFSAVLSLYSQNLAVDLVTLTDQLKKEGALEEVGGASYLTSLANFVPTAVNVEHYARIVREKYILRQLIQTSTQIASDCYEASQGADLLLDRAESLIFDIATRRISASVVPIKEVIKGSIETIDNLYQHKIHVTGLSTGFEDFDAMTAGLQPSDLIILAGRPSMGKSSFATCIAEHVGLVEKKPVVLFSLEMSKEHLVHRMLCSHARVDIQKARSGFLSESDWPRLASGAGKLAEAPIFIDDTPTISALGLRAKARRLKSRYDIRLIVLDYLQLMHGSTTSENRQQEISEISRSLKALARELNVALIAVSQLSRAPERRETYRPRLSDLRESGAIEQDADLVVLLFREDYYNPNAENKGATEVIIAKQRNGPVGSLQLTFLKEFARFENLSRRAE